jgi:selenide,water dikinase
MTSPSGWATAARGAGCGCKLPPDFLSSALSAMPGFEAFPAALGGADDFDDCAVWRLDDERALVATVDFFTPMVSDPGTFGAIAATNAISDVYAMGAIPRFALAIAGYPRGDGPAGLAEILRGGAEAALAQGCPVLGGHSVDDPEVKYGLAVVGEARLDELMTNAAGRPGDRLIVTKPLGIGIAIASGRDELLGHAVSWMLEPNAAAAGAARAVGIRCATDVTGFGLIGHVHEVARASGAAARVEVGRVPTLPETLELAAADIAPGGARRNRAALEGELIVADGVSDAELTALFDPQTSGGLLLGASPRSAAELVRDLHDAGVPAEDVGALEAGRPGRVSVVA